MAALEIIRGDNVSLPVTFTDAAGDPVDLTDCTVFLTVKNDLNDSDDDAIIATSVLDHSNAAAGETLFELNAGETNIDPGVYWWDLQIVDVNGVVTSTKPEKILVKADVTQRIA